VISPETVPADALAALGALVETRSGLRFGGGRSGELVTKLARAFAESKCATWPEYQAQVTNGALFEQLVETLTIGETYFYRHRPYFDMLEREILPEIVARRRDSKRLRLWCAGCATGEEAYSLAIAVRAVLPDVDDWQVTLLATDLNRGFLARAAAGVYGEWSFRETGAPFRAANFVADGPRWRVRPEVRQLVRFGQLNLAEDGYPSAASGTAALDLILCRNVLLYFGQDLTQKVVGRMRTALVPGGWLVLGPSDPRPGLLAEFEMHAGQGAVVYRRVDADRPRGDPFGGNWLTGSTAPLKVADQLPSGDPFGEKWLTAPTIPLEVADQRPIRDPFGETSPTVSMPAAIQSPPWQEWSSGSERSEADGAMNAEGDWHAAWLLARASADGGELDIAEEHCRQAMAMAHLRPEPYYLFGALRLARGDDAGSLEAHRKALYVDPRFVPALLAQAAIHRRGGATAKARQALVRAQRLLEGRVADEWVLADDGLTVGRLRDAVTQALGDQGHGA
jgi:chemotaxis protein methyltransferase CheR